MAKKISDKELLDFIEAKNVQLTDDAQRSRWTLEYGFGDTHVHFGTTARIAISNAIRAARSRKGKGDNRG